MRPEQQYLQYHNRRVRVTYKSPNMQQPNTVSGVALPPTDDQLHGGTAFFLDLEPGSRDKTLRVAADWIIFCEVVEPPLWAQRDDSVGAPSAEPWWV